MKEKEILNLGYQTHLENLKSKLKMVCYLIHNDLDDYNHAELNQKIKRVGELYEQITATKLQMGDLSILKNDLKG